MSTIDRERETKGPHQIFLDEELGSKKIYQKLVTILGTDSYGRSQIKIWLRKFRNGDLSCKYAPTPRAAALDFGP
jgi:hypothetical protein